MRGEDDFLCRMVGESLSKKVVSDQRHEFSEGELCGDLRGQHSRQVQRT